ncbi:MAG TPA: hypothetical protein VN698_14470 [Bacteroidia bacterium]|nr:hypothetical protein [Bacteroidia bacterium]
MKTLTLCKKIISTTAIIELICCQNMFGQQMKVAETNDLSFSMTLLFGGVFFIIAFVVLFILKLRDDNKNDSEQKSTSHITKHLHHHPNHYGHKHRHSAFHSK